MSALMKQDMEPTRLSDGVVIPIVPHNTIAEERLIGLVLYEPIKYGVVANLIEPRCFFHLKHNFIWNAIQAVVQNGLKIEFESVKNALEEAGNLEDAGGYAYLFTLANGVDLSMDIQAYARVVWKAWRMRGAMRLAQAIEQLARDATPDQFDDTLKKIDLQYEEWRVGNAELTETKQGRTLSEIMLDDMERVEALGKQGKPRGLPSGMRKLDKQIGGFIPEKLYLFGQETGGGKSSFAETILYNQRDEANIAYISLEMPDEEHANRLVAMHTGISADLQERGAFSPDQLQKSLDARLALGTAINAGNIWIDDRPGLSLKDIADSLDRFKRKRGVKDLHLVIVDHMQLVPVPGVRDSEIAARMKSVAEGLKDLAKRYHTAILALAQFNSGSPTGATSFPTMSNLYGGAAVKQAADHIWIGHRPEQYQDCPDDERGKLYIKCEKARGQAAFWKIELGFDANRTMIIGG